MTELCYDCCKPILMGQGSYYRKDPACDIGRTYHSECGYPFGIKAKLRPITMSDVRLVAGEGKLAPHTVLEAVNVILRQRGGDGEQAQQEPER